MTRRPRRTRAEIAAAQDAAEIAPLSEGDVTPPAEAAEIAPLSEGDVTPPAEAAEIAPLSEGDVTPPAEAAPDEADPEPDRAAAPDDWQRWYERAKKRRQRAAKTARELSRAAGDAQAPPASPERAQRLSDAKASASKVIGAKPGAAAGRKPRATPASRATDRERASVELCTAVARGTFATIPESWGGGDAPADARVLGEAWGPVVAPFLETEDGNSTGAWIVASVITAQVLIVRYLNAQRERERTPVVLSGYTPPAEPAPQQEDAPAPTYTPGDAMPGYLPTEGAL